MSRPAISSLSLNQHLTISECHPDSECRTNNWWLYDQRAGMNLAMRVESRDEAFTETIEYWAKRAMLAEKCYSDIKSQVDNFVGQFVKPEIEEEED